MQGGVLGSLCFLAFLLSSGVSGSGQNFQDQVHGGQEQFGNSEAEYGLSPLAKLENDGVDERSAQSLARARANAQLNAGGAYGPLNGQGYGNSVAQALADTNVNPFATNLYGPLSGYGSSQAQSQAQTQSLGLAQAQAQAQSLANAQLNHGGGLMDFYSPGSVLSDTQANSLANAYGGSSQAEAQALAQALSQGGGGLLTPHPGYVDSGLAAANALAHSMGGGGQGYSTAEALAQALSNVQSQPRLNDYPSGAVSSAEASALAQALGGGSRGIPGYGAGGAQSQAQAQAQAQTVGLGQARSFADALANSQALGGAYGSSYANAFADARTRVIPYHEYVLPYDIPGGQDIVRCTREGELHNLWTSRFECMVCACINRNGYLTPVCASCAGCLHPYNPVPPQPIPPSPEPIPLPIPLPRPQPQVSCYPLPTETPFENPLNPCQICVCHLTLDVYGQRDVQIACQENPECSITDIIVPILPQCERFPADVFFPHPHDICSQCMCIVDLATRAPHIVCSPRQNCDVPLPPQPPFNPPVPVPPRPPGPLPGPTPQPRCRYKPPLQPFVAECNICTCITVYNYVIAKCDRQPGCGVGPLYLGGLYGDAGAYSNAQVNQLLPQNYYPTSPLIGNAYSTAAAEAYAHGNVQSLPYGQNPVGSTYRPGYGSVPGPLLVDGELGPGPGYLTPAALAEAAAHSNAGYNQGLGSLSSAQANALSNAGLHPLRSYPSLSPGYQSGAVADAYSSGSTANSEALANALANINLGSGGYGSSSSLANANSGYQLYPGSGSGLSALSEAEAVANANLGYNAYLPGYQTGSLSSAEAEAIANANSGLYSGVPSKAYGSAASEAHSNVNSYPFAGQSSYPYTAGQSGASAEAEALANSNLYSGYGPQMNPMYGPGIGGSSNAQAQAQAQALANAALGQANAQSLSQASALAGRPLIKSGRGQCKYFGDKYHHSCQACYCLPDEDGSLVAFCLGTPCA
ncbi:hypothetical protein RR46_07377 [Papilio xuthus]|uniref:Uncharacterized protein n=1 Tax=Papilio xuthus TaxID=66420 RepID=A0A194Q2J7_PAPXU|nr:hypothetical protein RR46_07377 [Papilio xuthus]